MPATVVVVVIPEVPPIAGVNEFLWRIAANRSGGGGHALLIDDGLIQTQGINLSTPGAHRLEAAALEDVNLIHTAGANTSTAGAHTIAEAPPDESLVHTIGTNTSTAGAHTLAEAPPNEILVMTVGTNISTAGAHVLGEITTGAEEDDSMIGGAPIGSTPI